jgi:hypothetical protein
VFWKAQILEEVGDSAGVLEVWLAGTDSLRVMPLSSAVL